jgi:TPP-dependent 2-oxoacid decarboxylase
MGILSPDEVKATVETADVVMHFGTFPTDSNTAGWTWKFASEGLINLHPEYISIGSERFDNMSFVPVVKAIVKALESRKAIPSKGWWKKVSVDHTRYSESVDIRL